MYKGTFKRGDYIEVVLEDKGVGSEQYGTRPAVVIQNDIGNKYSPTIIVAFMTSSKTKTNIPTHTVTHELVKESTILCEQIRTISKKRVRRKLGVASDKVMKKVNQALLKSLDLY